MKIHINELQDYLETARTFQKFKSREIGLDWLFYLAGES